MQFHDLPDLLLGKVIKEHLGPLERLQLFQCCRPLAAAVLQHSTCTLTLIGRSANSHTSRHHTQLCRPWLHSLPMAGAPAKAEHAQHAQHVLQELLSDAASLHVVLHGSVSPRITALPMERVTCIQLQHFTVTVEALCHLHNFTALHTLVLHAGCASKLSAWDIAALVVGRKSWLPRSLTHLVLHKGCNISCIKAMAQLVGPQLTHYTSHCKDCFEQQHLIGFRRLTHLVTQWTVDHDMLRTLRCLPSLVHIVVAGVHVPNALQYHSGGKDHSLQGAGHTKHVAFSTGQLAHEYPGYEA